MNSSITRPSDTAITTTKRQGASLRPTAVALRASVAAVRDALEHMDAGAVLSVPIGTPGETFDVVEWCVRNDKPVINRFDAWPLDHLIVRNQVRTPTTDHMNDQPITRSNNMKHTPATTIHDTREATSANTDRRHPTMRRRPLRALRRSSRRDDRPPGQITHPTLVAQAITHRSVGSL